MTSVGQLPWKIGGHVFTKACSEWVPLAFDGRNILPLSFKGVKDGFMMDCVKYLLKNKRCKETPFQNKNFGTK